MCCEGHNKLQEEYLYIIKDGKTYTLKPLPDQKHEKEPLVVVLNDKEMFETIKESN